MKKNILIILILLLAETYLFAQQKRTINKHFNDFSFENITLNKQDFLYINMGDEMFTTQDVGKASLPVENTIIRVPEGARLVVNERIDKRDTVSLKNKSLVPKQHSRFKNDTSSYFDYDKEYYSSNTYGKDLHARLYYKGVMGSNGIYVLSLCPFRYNPYENKIEYIKDIALDFTLIGKKGEISFETKAAGASTYYTTNTPYKMVIVTNDLFVNTLNDFISWKKQQGYDITLLSTSQIGTTNTEIKAYLQNLYNNNSTPTEPAFDYLLIVGSVAMVPAFEGNYPYSSSENQATDLYYAEYTGDMLPEVFYGRMSCDDTSTLKNILNKTIKYEKYNFDNNDDNFLSNTLLVAGVETGNNAPTYTNGQMNYLKDYFKDLTDTSVYYNPSSGNADNVAAIKTKLFEGQGWILYSAHGDVNGWYKPSFKIGDIDTILSNTGKFGIYINNCCLTGSFDKQQCFTRSLLQAANKGGVAVIGASNYTLWDEDYHWSVGNKTISLHPSYQVQSQGAFDRLFHNKGQARNQWYTTMGQMISAGNLAVTQSLSSYTDYYWEIYNLQGDPTLMPYIGKAKNFEVSVADTIHLGNENILFFAPANTYACLSVKDSIISVCQSDTNGKIILNISSLVDTSDAVLVLTNQFYKPLIKNIVVKRADRPFIAIKDIVITPLESNEAVQRLQAGKSYNISFKIVNLGNTDINTNNNIITIDGNNDLLTFSENLTTFGNLNIGQETVFENAYNMTISPNAQNDNTINIIFSILCTGYEAYEQNITKKISAPAPEISSIAIKSTDQTIEIGANIYNQGRIATEEGIIKITNIQEIFNNSDSLVAMDIIEPRCSKHGVFILNKAQEDYDSLHFTIIYQAGNYSSTKEYALSLRQEIETFADGFSVFDWKNNDTHPWQITDTCYYFDNILNYNDNKSARSYKGLGNNASSILEVNLSLASSATISFYDKVSSEANYDKYYFYIDGEEKLVYSGEVDWTKESFVIPAGEHNIKFAYIKDYNTSMGYDAAWIDNFAISYSNDSLVYSLSNVINENISIYPNPANKTINFKGIKKESKINIFDSFGRLCLQQELTDDYSNINIDFLSSGTYYIVISDNQGIYSRQKLLVIK